MRRRVGVLEAGDFISNFAAEVRFALSLAGSIPPELGNLASLGTFFLNDNLLSGESLRASVQFPDQVAG